MYKPIKRFLVGDPISTAMAHHERINKKTALAVFSSDALSSVAYSTEAILVVLVAEAGGGAHGYLVPIVFGIVVLLAILTLSYRQTIKAYPSGGGAYIVAKDNLGTLPGLVAGASLLVDYILTVAVSISAGVAAITSATNGTRFEFLQQHRVVLCLLMIAFIAVVNLRGVRESGAIFAGPTYLFILGMLVLIVGGFVRYYATGQMMPPPEHMHYEEQTATFAHSAIAGGALTWLILRAFAAGCTALTGVEAISNGVPAFQPPESHNASVTLTWMAVVMTVLILGTGLLAYKIGAIPVGEEETLVSAMTRHTFGAGAVYYYVQATTAAILVLAANTSFADFPRLSSLLAADRFLPRQLANRGDRLVFSNGIVVLALLAAVLVVIFKGSEQAMLPLYALGVFCSFTLSQAGMVVHWMRERKAEEVAEQIRAQERAEDLHRTIDPGLASHELERLAALESDRGGHWLLPTVINGAGAIVTFVVGAVIVVTKFTHGAWAVVVVIALIVLMFRSINRHYRFVSAQLSLGKAKPPKDVGHNVIIPVSGIHRGVLPALRYARSLCGERDHGCVNAVYVEVNPQATEELRRQWEKWGMGVPLKVIESPYRSITTPLLNYIHEEARRHEDSMTTVVLPEFVPRGLWQHLLHNQTALLLKAKLLFDPKIIVTSVPYHLRR
ncbi:MAG TPA: APC family permease [Pyrinomonadaceae bacterium]|jgi:amino acid transporter|nr:APC family permease [Pyrinomonadaceae bacterium]